MSAAISNGSRNWLNSVWPSQAVLLSFMARRRGQPLRPSDADQGEHLNQHHGGTMAHRQVANEPSRITSTLMSSIITTNRNSTITAPT